MRRSWVEGCRSCSCGPPQACYATVAGTGHSSGRAPFLSIAPDLSRGIESRPHLDGAVLWRAASILTGRRNLGYTFGMLLTFDHGEVRELRLNRPPVNALTSELLSDLRQAVGQAAQEGAGAVILSGLPGRFSAGLDVPLLLTLHEKAIS